MTEINSFTVGGEVAGQPEAAEAPPEAQHPELTETMQKLQAGLDAKVEQVRNDTTLDNGTRFRLINHLWNQAQEVRKDTEAEYRAVLEDRTQTAVRKIFHTSPSERDSVRSAYNDIQSHIDLAYTSGDREGMEYGREQLEEMFERAVRTDDRPLQKACFHYATEKGIASIRDRYLAGSKEKSKAWEDYNFWGKRLANFDDPQEAMWRNMTGVSSLKRPPELG